VDRSRGLRGANPSALCNVFIESGDVKTALAICGIVM
jgi:hypothetical protein